MKKYGEMNVNKYREMKDSRFKKGLRIIKREGLLSFTYRFFYYLNRCFLRIASPVVINLIPRRYFYYKNKRLSYFLHKKNLTWTNERAIEVPIIMDYVKNSVTKKILEVGAVLHHYYPKFKHDVLDKFEKSKGIINEDVVNFKPKERYDLIISISTLEHVGFDDDIKDSEGIIKALNNLKENCLKKNGKMIITLPLNYNKYVDKYIYTNQLSFDEEHFFKRVGFNKWKETSKEKVKQLKYNSERLNANAILVGLIEK